VTNSGAVGGRPVASARRSSPCTGDSITRGKGILSPYYKEMNHTTRTSEAGRGVGRFGVNYGYQFRLLFDCGTGRVTSPCAGDSITLGKMYHVPTIPAMPVGSIILSGLLRPYV
jgi:hypothetical protein